MARSILRKLQLSMLAFGITMGFIFPIYASFFVIWKTGMFVWFFIGCLLAGLTVGLVSFWFVKTILIRKLKDISYLANRIQNRDISALISIESNDEIGEIVDGLNSSVKNIRDLFEEILKVFSVSESVLSSVNQSSAVNQIMHSIDDVVENTATMAEQSYKIEKAVNRGQSISECTSSKQLNTIQQVKEFSVVMDSLLERSKTIKDILHIIEGIANETNILALNASVEAARAGEFGKGFAVVASEIRKLANNTQDSSQNISQTINIIQDDLDNAYKLVENISSDVAENNSDVLSIIKQFNNINHTVGEKLQSNQLLKNSVTSLSHSFNDVQGVFKELKKYLEQLNNMVGEYKVK